MKKLLIGLTLLSSVSSFATETPTVDSFTFEMAKEFVLQNGDKFPEEKAAVETLNKIEKYIPSHSAGLLAGGPVSTTDIAKRQSAKIIQLLVRDYEVKTRSGLSVREFHKLNTSELATQEIDPLSYAAFINKHLEIKEK